jgi:hypothetical protein
VIKGVKNARIRYVYIGGKENQDIHEIYQMKTCHTLKLEEIFQGFMITLKQCTIGRFQPQQEENIHKLRPPGIHITLLHGAQHRNKLMSTFRCLCLKNGP